MKNDNAEIFEAFLNNRSQEGGSEWRDKIEAGTSQEAQRLSRGLKTLLGGNYNLSPALWGKAIQISSELVKLVDMANSERGRMIK